MKNENHIHQLVEEFISEEKNRESNPFLSTRIMAAIEDNKFPGLSRVSVYWKTAIVAMSLVAAVVTGVATGSLYHSKNNTSDIVLMNDHSMENFGFYNQIGNE